LQTIPIAVERTQNSKENEKPYARRGPYHFFEPKGKEETPMTKSPLFPDNPNVRETFETTKVQTMNIHPPN